MFITRIRPTLLFSTGEEPGGSGEGPAPETAPETTITADTPVAGTGTVDSPMPEIPAGYIPESRYKELQGAFTRTSQEAAQLRQQAQLVEAWNSGDPDQQRWAAEQLGIQLQDDDDSEDESTIEQPTGLSDEDRQLLEAFRQEREQEQQTRQQQEQLEQYRSIVDPQLESMGIDKAFHDDIAEAALHLPAIQGPDGPQPDLEGAVKQIEQIALRLAGMPGVQPKLFEKLRQTKRAPTVASGGAGTQVPSLDTSQNRVKFMMDRAAQMGD